MESDDDGEDDEEDEDDDEDDDDEDDDDDDDDDVSGGVGGMEMQTMSVMAWRNESNAGRTMKNGTSAVEDLRNTNGGGARQGRATGNTVG